MEGTASMQGAAVCGPHCCGCHPLAMLATAPGRMEELLFGEKIAWEGAERSNEDVTFWEKLSPGAGLLQPSSLWH